MGITRCVISPYTPFLVLPMQSNERIDIAFEYVTWPTKENAIADVIPTTRRPGRVMIQFQVT